MEAEERYVLQELTDIYREWESSIFKLVIFKNKCLENSFEQFRY